jgi:hypothetical protein
MNKYGFAIIAALVVIWLSNSKANAEPVYRDDAKVIEPPKPVMPPDKITPAINEFSKLYKKAHSPKIVLFWNMMLTDSVKDSQNTVNISGNSKISGGSKTAEDSKFSVTKSESKGQTDINGKRNTTLPERDMWKVQTVFMNTMRDAGVRFIDRNSILRTTALKENTDNISELETKALLNKANLYMEVLLTRDEPAPIGWGFKVSLRDLNTGEELSSIYTQAQPVNVKVSNSQYHATDNGFEKATYKEELTIRDIGEALAFDVMSDIGPALNQK